MEIERRGTLARELADHIEGEIARHDPDVEDAIVVVSAALTGYLFMLKAVVAHAGHDSAAIIPLFLTRFAADVQHLAALVDGPAPEAEMP